jgi:ferredoxin
MVKVKIYYYSGTGNSLHIARELQKRIPDSELIPILKFSGKKTIRVDSERMGLVFPIYFTTIPSPVRDFITRLDLTSVKYIFMTATRIGTFTIADKLVNALLRKRGRNLDSHLIVNMASNSPTGLKPGKGDPKWMERTSEKEIERMEMELLPDLKKFATAVNRGEKFPDRAIMNPIGTVARPFMDLMTKGIKSEVGYFVDDTCIGCGACERVCLSNKIKLVDGKPVWNKEIRCFYCFACFNFCPEQSILVRKKYDSKDGRYHHPGVTMEDIIAQK